MRCETFAKNPGISPIRPDEGQCTPFPLRGGISCHRLVTLAAGLTLTTCDTGTLAPAAVAALPHMLQQCLRILRVLRLIRRLAALRDMITTFYISLPAVVNFGGAMNVLSFSPV